MRLEFYGVLALCATLQIGAAGAQTNPQTRIAGQEQAADFIAHDFHFQGGVSLPEVNLHYVTLGTLNRDARGP